MKTLLSLLLDAAVFFIWTCVCVCALSDLYFGHSHLYVYRQRWYWLAGASECKNSWAIAKALATICAIILLQTGRTAYTAHICRCMWVSVCVLRKVYIYRAASFQWQTECTAKQRTEQKKKRLVDNVGSAVGLFGFSCLSLLILCCVVLWTGAWCSDHTHTHKQHIHSEYFLVYLLSYCWCLRARTYIYISAFCISASFRIYHCCVSHDHDLFASQRNHTTPQIIIQYVCRILRHFQVIQFVVAVCCRCCFIFGSASGSNVESKWSCPVCHLSASECGARLALFFYRSMVRCFESKWHSNKKTIDNNNIHTRQTIPQ